MTEEIVKMDVDKRHRKNAPASSNSKKDQSQKSTAASSSRGRNNRGRYRKRGKKPSEEENNTNGNGHQKKRPKPSKNSNICFQFAEKGICDRGDKCRFIHQLEEGENGRGTTETTATVRSPISNSGDSFTEEEQMEEEPVSHKAHITNHRFEDLSISTQSRDALAQVFRYEFMTVVQAETLPLILKGEDCLAKAKTGTGKTLAFLIPTVEVIQKKMASRQVDANDICSLVISPTRELAFQISSEAKSLLTHHEKINVVACVGGTNINKDLRALEKSVQIIVATPGRLLDHLENSGFLAPRMAKLEVLVLDEADQLLDMGFRPDIERILKILKSSETTRQTLLFSATVPKSVSEIAAIALRPKYNYVDTVGENEEQTHLHVTQQVMVAPDAQHISILANILANETKKKPYKIIVFFTTARLTGFMAELFNSVRQDTGIKVLEIHSRKSQAVRKKASDAFRQGKNGVLFSSDVSARGMDYPDVTLVVQVGLTERAQYIHRLGRTARAGKQGRGVLLLAPHEESHMVQKELSDLPLERVDVPLSSHATEAVVSKALGQVSRDKSLQVSAEQAYRAWLGYYNSNLKKCNWKKDQLVVEANQWAKDVGLAEQPRLQRKTVGKMGLKGVPGLLLE